MAQILVRNLDDIIRDRLRELARRHGRSMEEEIRQILRAAAFKSSGRRKTKRSGVGEVESDVAELGDPAEIGLGTWIRKRFYGIGLRPSERIEEVRGGEPMPPDFTTEDRADGGADGGADDGPQRGRGKMRKDFSG